MPIPPLKLKSVKQPAEPTIDAATGMVEPKGNGKLGKKGPNAVKARFVIDAVRAGASLNQIASALKTTPPTLKKYYGQHIAKAKLDIPNLASGRVHEYLADDFEWMPSKDKRNRARVERAKLAVQILLAHGWKDDGSLVNKNLSLPRVKTSVVPDSNDESSN